MSPSGRLLLLEIISPDRLHSGAITAVRSRQCRNQSDRRLLSALVRVHVRQGKVAEEPSTRNYTRTVAQGLALSVSCPYFGDTGRRIRTCTGYTLTAPTRLR